MVYSSHSVFTLIVQMDARTTVMEEGVIVSLMRNFNFVLVSVRVNDNRAVLYRTANWLETLSQKGENNH
jgi:hypothetical protein